MDILYLIISIIIMIFGSIMSDKSDKKGQSDIASVYCFVIACGGIMLILSLFSIFNS